MSWIRIMTQIILKSSPLSKIVPMTNHPKIIKMRRQLFVASQTHTQADATARPPWCTYMYLAYSLTDYAE